MKVARSKADSKKADSKLKSKGAAAGKRSVKAAKDPNKPKRPPSAFFVFMEDFRKQFKEENPNNKSVSAVSKAGGEKWKQLSDAEKAPFVKIAEKRKTEYNKHIQAYNLKLAGENTGADEDGSDKSKSEVNDEEDEGTGSGEDGDDE